MNALVPILVIALVQSILAAAVLFRARKRFTKGKVHRLVTSIILALMASMVYIVWELFLAIAPVGGTAVLIKYVLLMAVLCSFTFLSYEIAEFAATFGFKR
jgi:hypothetical protein